MDFAKCARYAALPLNEVQRLAAIDAARFGITAERAEFIKLQMALNVAGSRPDILARLDVLERILREQLSGAVQSREA